MSTVLVTGANGYIGRHTLPALLRRGFGVVACCYGPAGERLPGVLYVEADLRDDAAIATLLTEYGPTHLLHLAWDVTPGQYLAAPSNLDWLHITARLAQAFLQAGGQRLITMGTCAEYAPSDAPRSEDAALADEPLYAAAKTSVRYLSAALAKAAGATHAHARLFYPYGMDEAPQRVVPLVLGRLAAGQPVDVSAGMQVRDYVFIDDVGEALAAITASDLTGPVNVGSGEGIALRAIFEAMEELLDAKGLVRYGALPMVGVQAPSMVADIGRLKGIGWRPEVNIREGLRRTLAYLREESEHQ